MNKDRILPWDRFSNWIRCFCVVTFDLELGQAMEFTYPGHVKLTEQEKMNICYLAFPDSNSGCMGDTQFHFRIRQSPGRHILNTSHVIYNKNCPPALQVDHAFYYGYVYFRQVKDKTQRRGYFQKSFVLLSRLPFMTLFHHMNAMIAPVYFDKGEAMIEAACHDIDHWTPPLPGDTLNLPLMGTIIQTRIMNRLDKLGSSSLPGSPQHVPGTVLPAPIILPSVYESPLYRCLVHVLPHIHLLWELVLIGEPIVVMSSSPTACSLMVQALVSMIWPLRYCGDFRPYFTIHDSEFKEFTSKTHAPPPVVLGVTNPFFAKTLQHWPHILRVADCGSEVFNKASKGKVKKVKTLDSKPGLYTQYKSYLQKDKVFLKKLLKGIQLRRPPEVQSALLRRYLLEHTTSFIIPLERYMASLMPLQRNISPYKAAPSVRPFDPEEMISSIGSSGPQLTSGVKGDWEGLYRRFFRSPNFCGWYNARYEELTHKLDALHLDSLATADVVGWSSGRGEVEVVDMLLRIRDKLKHAQTAGLPIGCDTIGKLHEHMDSLSDTLPQDLQAVLDLR